MQGYCKQVRDILQNKSHDRREYRMGGFIHK